MARAPVSETSCPSCDAPAAAAARRCERCGYRFVEDGGRATRVPVRPLPALGGIAAVALAAAGVVLIGSGGEDEPSAARPAHLQVVSEHPLTTPAAERLLERRYTALRKDDTAVSCSEREAKPAHSVRRCLVHYRDGSERRVVLLTNARGNEVLSKP